jgi:hypothetical protein
MKKYGVISDHYIKYAWRLGKKLFRIWWKLLELNHWFLFVTTWSPFIALLSCLKTKLNLLHNNVSNSHISAIPIYNLSLAQVQLSSNPSHKTLFSFPTSSLNNRLSASFIHHQHKSYFSPLILIHHKTSILSSTELLYWQLQIISKSFI